jgi:negative regulator of flagellin synthesis FlgM
MRIAGSATSALQVQKRPAGFVGGETGTATGEAASIASADPAATGAQVSNSSLDAASSTSSSPVAVAPLQTAVLQPALRALRAMPDMDVDRVAELRDAIARGEVPFDAGKLAGLIQRFHGRQS